MRDTTPSLSETASVTVPDLLTAAEVGHITHMKASSLAQMRYKGTGPKFVKLGSRVLYRKEDVTAWINGNIRTITGGEA